MQCVEYRNRYDSHHASFEFLIQVGLEFGWYYYLFKTFVIRFNRLAMCVCVCLVFLGGDRLYVCLPFIAL